MLNASTILQKAVEYRIDLNTAPIIDILPIYKIALKETERELDISDNTKISMNEIDILEGDLRQVIASLHDLRDDLTKKLDAVVNYNTTHTQLVTKFYKSLKYIDRAKRKIREALDELYTASDMLTLQKERSFRKCFRDFKSDLSEASSALSMLEFDIKQINTDETLINIIKNSRLETENVNSIVLTSKFINYSSKIIRILLMEGFDDGHLTALCFDHFREVFEEFTNNMDKSTKIAHLMIYCSRKGQMEALLKLIEREVPEKYNQYKENLVNSQHNK